MKISFIALCILLITACGPSKSDMGGDTLIWEISSERVDCEDVFPQKCLQVREKGSSEYTFFYDTIKGFDYKEGTQYTVKLRKNNVTNPPADGSNVSYELEKVLEKKVIRKIIEPSFRGYYKLTHLRGKVVYEPDLSFNINNQKRRVHGFSGCNNYTVPFLSSKNSLKFELLASTKKFCQESMNVEKEFLSVFKEVRSYKVSNGTLTLFDKKGDELLQARSDGPF